MALDPGPDAALARDEQRQYEDTLDKIVDTVTGPFKDWYENRLYREYKIHAWKRRKKQTYNHSYFYRLAAERPALANKFKRRFKAEADAWENTHSKQNGKVSDPSGIVYEAVLSNPVEGATVKLYTFNPAASNYGMDPAQFVDSTQFGIEDNPQTTGADGRYQWFVPSGYWQVRVSKKGYESFSTGDYGHEEQRPTYKVVHNDELDADEYVPVTGDDGEPEMETVEVGDYGLDGTKILTYTDANGVEQTVEADSYWMPVLPIQLDVNIPLVSLDPPEIEKIEADGDGVTVTFTKYVRPDTVTADLFEVGGAEPSAIEAVDAEAAGDGSGEMLARTYRLSYPAGTRLSGGDNDVSVTYDDPEGQVTSYAGVGVAGDTKVSKVVVAHVDTVDIASATVASIANQTYNGKALEPAPVVKVGGATLAKGTDYTLAYANNTKPGTATITITGKGNYTGTKSVKFTINKADVSKATVAAIAAQTYSGKALAPTPKVTLGGRTLAKGTDYTLSYKNNTNAGTATVTVTGKGNYTGTKPVTFKIKPADVSKATIATIAAQAYLGSGKEVKPAPKVTLGGRTLKSGTDFKLSYKDNAPKFAKKTQTQTATVTDTGTGNYAGTKSAKFTIKYIKPTWSGASRMPVRSTAAYATTNGGWIRIKSGGARKTSDGVLSVSGKTVSAAKAGSSTLVLIDPFGTEIATRKVTVFAAHGKTFEFESSVDKSYVLDIQGGSKKDGAQMIVYKRNGGKNQRYQLYLQSDGTYGIKSVNSGKWLTVESKTDKYVQQWAWRKGSNNDQRWRVTVDASNRVTFVNVKTSKCFDVQGGKTKNSAKMIVWQYNGGLNQKWKLNQK